jgi:hypothetical protein
MSWYRLAQQQDNWSNILKSNQAGTSANPQGILVGYADYQKLKSFGTGSGPISVMDKDTNQNVTVVHGGMDPNGKFAFADGKGGFVYPNKEDDPNYDPNNPEFQKSWADRLGVNASNYIVSCYEGAANAGDFKAATNYRGKLEMSMPQTVTDTTQDVRINVSGA